MVIISSSWSSRCPSVAFRRISLMISQTPWRVRGSEEVDFALSKGMISPRMRSPNLRHNSPTVLEAIYGDD